MMGKLARELNHNRKILETAEDVWGRSGKAGQLRLERRADMILDTFVVRLSQNRVFSLFNSLKMANLSPPRRGCNIKTRFSDSLTTKSKKVLEIGCGTGTLTKYLAELKIEVIATDIFPEFLKIAQRQINADNVVFRPEDAEKLSGFNANQFDLVCGLSILHHLKIKDSLRNIYRVLKPGGLIAFSEPNMLNPQIALQKNIPWLKRLMGDSPDETAFFKWQMKKYLRDSGFNEVSVTAFDFLHPSLPDFLVPTANFFGLILEKIPSFREIAGSLFITAKK